MPLLKTITLGCKVNQYETEYLREGLGRLGYRDARDGEAADLCIVNTCTVTVEGEAKSRKLIRQLARQNPQAEIVVMGCYATRAREAVAALAGVAEVIADKRQLPDWLARRGLVDVPTGISTFGPRHRAYVKVQDGCSMECSYCIIPRVRPVLWSRPLGEILDEISRLVAAGHREIVLTGIHLGHYGIDRDGGENLAGLLRRIVGRPGEFRVRLSSLEAAELTDELVAAVAEHPDRVCPHLHVSMQSGSNAVLRRMRRRWPAERLIERLDAVRAALDRPALTTDVIVGFPGETDEDFRATCRAVEAVGFSKLHIFRFSPRQGTEAAEMPDRVPGAVQQDRAAQLAQLGNRLRQAYFEGLAGRRLQVLVERCVAAEQIRLLPTARHCCDGGRGNVATPSEEVLVGMSDRYAPVELAGGPEQIGRLVWVVAGRVAAGRILAQDRPIAV
ncbi:MAG: tRNA (N(6)-L-threonylcarbamoyladenosine(37)-C(2))-methylthiotransferase MtaB [Thermoguttaceae bacterium]|jgi:threonylcarbamoyladenosine tRNA methylthiotransferase MtaB